MSSEKPPSATVLVWWIIWLALIAGIIAIWRFMPASSRVAADGIRYLPIAPLVMSSLLRWLVLPRFTDRIRAFPVFIIGLALSEGCAILGMNLVPDMRDTYTLLGLMGLAQFVPVFASRLR